MVNSPLISFCILSYKQEAFISEAILSAINQDYSNLEIIVSDDNSPDNTYSVIEQTIKQNPTSHKVVLNRNKTNLGLVEHLNYVLNNLVHGEYIMLMGGDDISTYDRASHTINYFSQYPNVGGLVFSYDIINSSGLFLRKCQLEKDTIYNMSSYKWLSSSSFVIGGLALAFRKSKYDLFGPLGDCHTEDSTIRFRVLLCSDFLYSSKICLQYRRHESNITSSENLYSLKTSNISNQYYRDLKIAYERNFITRRLYKLADNKIKWYIKERNLLEKSHFSKSILLKVWYHLFNKIFNCVFFLRSVFLQLGKE